MDCNLPEFLVQDLELSVASFASRDMTAGPPLRSLASDPAMRLSKQQSGDQSMRESYSPYHDAASRICSLSMIEERCSLPGDVDAENEDPSSDQDDASSYASTESTSHIGIAPIRLRHRSVTTAATSMTSASPSAASTSCHPLTPPTPTHQGSWMDLEPDGEELDACSESEEAGLRPDCSPSAMNDLNGPMLSRRASKMIEQSPIRARPTSAVSVDGSHGSISISRCSPRGRKHLSQPSPTLLSLDIPKRRSSLSQYRALEGAEVACLQRLDDLPNLDTSATAIPENLSVEWSQAPGGASAIEIPQLSRRISASLYAQSITILGDAEGDEATSDTRKSPQTWTRPTGLARCQSAFNDSTSMSHIQKWLQSSAPASQRDGLLPPSLPLPPEVVETLRVSINCFPDTMLLSSSLTIETIRSYSKKVKEPNHMIDMKGSSEQQGQPSRWRRAIMPSRRPSMTFGPRDRSWSTSFFHHQPRLSAALSSDTASPVAPPWHALKSVFPNGPAHLCDALYAHILAYNYLASLCHTAGPVGWPAQMAQSASASACDASSLEDANSMDVPRKAARLLGMGRCTPTPPSQEEAPPPAKPARRHLPVLGRFGRDRDDDAMHGSWKSEVLHRPSISSMRPPEDAANRELLSGLARCIARLVATLRSPATSLRTVHVALSTPSITNELVGVDPFFIRSLCEVVRRAEE